MDLQPPARPTLGLEPATQARALSAWFIGRCLTTEPHRMGGVLILNFYSLISRSVSEPRIQVQNTLRPQGRRIGVLQDGPEAGERPANGSAG